MSSVLSSMKILDSLAAMKFYTRAAVGDNVFDFYDLVILRNQAD